MPFKICNRSGIPDIEVFISKYSNGDGNDDWFTLPNPEATLITEIFTFDLLRPDQYETWGRSGWEVVVFKDPSTGRRRGWYLNGADNLHLTFYRLDAELGLVKA
ncbi:hypothetical protein BKA70DRAFT_1505044 [Coprinopsis sp. MPI-PUGE-AT-0042]|nr:hypothetical protein BKA70DRAFT_1505044 [Coprinopsis sp. MPI-PUGE-AT-0042]